MRDPNSLGRFSAGPSNDMSGNLRFSILNQFFMFVEFHFYFIFIFLSFRKYPDFERKGKILSLFGLSSEKLAEKLLSSVRSNSLRRW